MFFVLSKILDLAFTPLAWALLLGALALLLGRRRPRWALGLGLGALFLLWTFSTPWVAEGLTRWTEGDVSSTQRPGKVYDAVIVLGGMAEPGQSLAAGRPQFAEASDRLLTGRQVLLSGAARHLIISGGRIPDLPQVRSEADLVGDTLLELGVPAEQILREDQSRNTRENAVYTAAIVRERGFESLLLVTSAFHMQRSLGCFRAVGLEPDVLPTDVRQNPLPQGPGALLPRAEALEDSTKMLRELAGRLIYRVRGYAR